MRNKKEMTAEHHLSAQVVDSQSNQLRLVYLIPNKNATTELLKQNL